jgi:hypothetical protein
LIRPAIGPSLQHHLIGIYRILELLVQMQLDASLTILRGGQAIGISIVWTSLRSHLFKHVVVPRDPFYTDRSQIRLARLVAVPPV